jgi:hypothetical protein
MTRPSIAAACMNLSVEDAVRRPSLSNQRELRAPLADINETCLHLLIELAHLPGEPVSEFIGVPRCEISPNRSQRSPRARRFCSSISNFAITHGGNPSQRIPAGCERCRPG